MGQISGIIFLAAVWYLGTINFLQTIILGTFIFVISLMISRYFDKYITVVTKKILRFLDRHTETKKFILKYF